MNTAIIALLAILIAIGIANILATYLLLKETVNFLRRKILKSTADNRTDINDLRDTLEANHAELMSALGETKKHNN